MLQVQIRTLNTLKVVFLEISQALSSELHPLDVVIVKLVGLLVVVLGLQLGPREVMLQTAGAILHVLHPISLL